MNLIIGIAVTLISLVGWLGQVISWAHRPTAVKWGMAEADEDVDPVFLADAQGEAAWDSLILWILPVAGILLMFDHAWWPYFGVAGGSMYIYFGGRSLSTRKALKRRGIRICRPEFDRVYTFAIALWGLVGAGMVIYSIRALCS